MSYFYYCSYSVFPMAIANDMIIAVGSEENTTNATEFYVHNVVCFSNNYLLSLESQIRVKINPY